MISIPEPGRRLAALLLAALLPTLALAAPPLPPINEPSSGESLHGKFIWFDLATAELDAQKAFYQDVFGWSYRSPGRAEDAYTLIVNRGRAVGGMFRFDPPGGEQDGATWAVLMSVADPDATASAVQAAGGSVEVAPASVASRGRHALFLDPGGALFGALRSDSGDPPDAEVPIGGFFWVDLFARDVEAMADFYSGLAPYTQDRHEVAEGVYRTMLIAHDYPRAGIVRVDEEANRSAWVPYVRVADVEATLDKVVAGGGFAIVPPDPQLLDGNLAVFVDPHGGVTGIVKWNYDGDGP